MTKPKWTHKEDYGREYYSPYCGQTTYNTVSAWKNVTCPKCLIKKPKSKDYLSFELEGKVFITERKAGGKIISQNEIDGKLVLQCLASLLEKGMREELIHKEFDKICEYCKIKNCNCEEWNENWRARSGTDES